MASLDPIWTFISQLILVIITALLIPFVLRRWEEKKIELKEKHDNELLKRVILYRTDKILRQINLINFQIYNFLADEYRDKLGDYNTEIFDYTEKERLLYSVTDNIETNSSIGIDTAQTEPYSEKNIGDTGVGTDEIQSLDSDLKLNKRTVRNLIYSTINTI